MYPVEKLASPSVPVSLGAAAVVFALLCPVAKRLEEGRRKPLETLCRDTVDDYVNALHNLLEFNDYMGEFVSLNAPESSQYRCFADRHGKIVTITVQVYGNMILFHEDGRRVHLFETA